ncbi:MAG: RHS repeat-associated core domain-containing protein [Planctomycetota bacterium]
MQRLAWVGALLVSLFASCAARGQCYDDPCCQYIYLGPTLGYTCIWFCPPPDMPVPLVPETDPCSITLCEWLCLIQTPPGGPGSDPALCLGSNPLGGNPCDPCAIAHLICAYAAACPGETIEDLVGDFISPANCIDPCLVGNCPSCYCTWSPEEKATFWSCLGQCSVAECDEIPMVCDTMPISNPMMPDDECTGTCEGLGRYIDRISECALDNGSCLLSDEQILDLVCQWATACAGASPLGVDSSVCLDCVEGVLGRQLTADERLEVLLCLGCYPCIGSGPDPDPSVACDAGMVTCDSLRDYLSEWIACLTIDGTEPTRADILAEICTRLKDASCMDTLAKRCQALGSILDSGCLTELLGGPMTYDELYNLLECSGCVQCVGCDGVPVDCMLCTVDQPGNWDYTGDGQVGCDDLYFHVIGYDICRKNAGCAVTDADRRSRLLDFWENAPHGISCDEAAKCIRSASRTAPTFAWWMSFYQTPKAGATTNCFDEWCASQPDTGSVLEAAPCDLDGDCRFTSFDTELWLEFTLICRGMTSCMDGSGGPALSTDDICSYIRKGCYLQYGSGGLTPCEVGMTIVAVIDQRCGLLLESGQGSEILACAGLCESGVPEDVIVKLGLDHGDLFDVCSIKTQDNIESAEPVHLFTGAKSERVVDLAVALTGEDFELVRSYTSSTAESVGQAPVGRNWTLSAFQKIVATEIAQHIKDLGVPDEPDLLVRDVSLNSIHSYWEDPTTGLFQSRGTTSQYIDGAVSGPGMQHGSGPTAAQYFVLYEPGHWEKWYYVKDDNIFADDIKFHNALKGHLIREIDVYGNERRYTYDWVLEDGAPGTEDKVARLRSIRCYRSGQRTYPDANIQFHWDYGGDSRLRRVVVSRPTGFIDGRPEAWEETQSVEYLYRVPSGAATSQDANLVQVNYRTRVDRDEAGSDEPFWTRMRQYRYHNGELDAAEQTDERQNVRGLPHQLKMVIEPEQIEWVAQQRMAADPSDSLESVAAEIRLNGDGHLIDAANGITTRDLAAKIIGYRHTKTGGTVVFESANPRVDVQFLQSACGGCGSGNPQGLKQAFEYIETSVGGTTASTVVEDFLVDLAGGPGEFETIAYRTKYYDHVIRDGSPYLEIEAVEENALEGGRIWATKYAYGAGQNNLIREYSPSSILTYTVGTAMMRASAMIRPADGLVTEYGYTGDNRLAQTLLRAGDDTSTRSLIEEFTYGDSLRPWLPTKIERIRTEGQTSVPATTNDVEETTFEYDFLGGAYPNAVIWSKTSIEAELITENGPEAAVTTYGSEELYDQYGRNYASLGLDGCITLREFDDRFGLPTKISVNESNVLFLAALAPTPTAPGFDETAWGESIDEPGETLFTKRGGRLVTEIEYDALGRPTKTVAPDGVTTRIVREIRSNGVAERSGFPGYYAEIMLPHDMTADPDEGATPFLGMASIAWHNAGGELIRTSSYTLDADDIDYAADPIEYALTDSDLTAPHGTENERARSTIVHTYSGLIEETRDWHNLTGLALIDPGARPDEARYLSVQFEYDQLGRLTQSRTRNGTFTGHEYDVLDRRVASWTDTTGGHVTPPYFEKIYFDGDPTVSDQGVGNGNISRIERFTGESMVVRATRFYYDFRDRLVWTLNPLAPHTFTTYDNLDRPASVSVYESATEPPPSAPGEIARGRHAETQYSQRGLIYRTRLAIDPKSATPDFLETNLFLDSKGRARSEQAPSSPGIKRLFDAHDRVITRYVTDRGGDTPTGGRAHHFNVTSDIVLEQVTHVYNADTAAGLAVPLQYNGLLDNSTTYLRNPADTETGSLDGHTVPPVPQFVGFYYDPGSRLRATIDFGSFRADDVFAATEAGPQSSPFATGSWPPDDLAELNQAAYNDAIISRREYNKRGLVSIEEDPEGRATLWYYDHLDRVFGIVDNFLPVSGVGAYLGWESDGSGGFRWVGHYVGGDLSGSLDVAVNRATSIEYDGSGNARRRIAHLPRSGDLMGTGPDPQQSTFYDYDTSIAGATSLINSKDLLARIRYPDSSGDSDTVRFGYNLLAEQIESLDQMGTSRAFTRDQLGRITADAATLTPGSGVDGAVTSITTGYDTLGRVTEITSLNGSSVVNQVSYTYDNLDGLWNIQAIKQNPLGPTSDPMALTVGFDWDTARFADGNYNRLNRTDYPYGSTTIASAYATGVDDTISRISGYDAPGFGLSSSLLRYEYTGLAMPTKVDLHPPDVSLDRAYANGTSVTHGFAGLDRHGRVRRHTWRYNASGKTLPLLDELHAYDDASNRLTRVDGRPAGVDRLAKPDFVYGYDSNHRLTEVQRGDAEGGIAIVQAGFYGELWQLDILGNWDTLQRDLDGTMGAFGESGDISEARTHNDANELGDIGAETATYDGNGNLATLSSGGLTYEYTHDAWNRLTRVLLRTSPTFGFELGAFGYNGLHHRVTAQRNAAQVRLYYDGRWRILEERGGTLSGGVFTLRDVAQNFYGSRGADDLVARRWHRDVDSGEPSPQNYFALGDVQGSIVAVLDGTGGLLERLEYDAYGRHRHFWYADTNRDGEVDDGTLDWPFFSQPLSPSTIPDTSAAYEPDADLDFDGDIDGADTALFQAHKNRVPLASNLLGDPGGAGLSHGYGGYAYETLVGLYHARNRWYSTELGRFLQRDPAGYVDGMNLYGYGGSSPFVFMDPWGLFQQAQDFVQQWGYDPAAVQADAWRIGMELRHGVTASPPPQPGLVDRAARRVVRQLPHVVMGTTSGATFGSAMGGALGLSAGPKTATPGALLGGAIGATTGFFEGVFADPNEPWIDTGKRAAVMAMFESLLTPVLGKILGPLAKTGRMGRATASDCLVVDDVAEAAAPRWRAGRYSNSASSPGAYLDSGRRVFPTRRNSGLRGDQLRQEQVQFTRKRLAEGADIEEIRGQAAAAGLTRTFAGATSHLADPGAERAVQRGLEMLEPVVTPSSP